MTAPRDYNAAQFAAGALTWDHITALVRAWQVAHGLEVDGMAGPLTISSIAYPITKARPFLSRPLPVLADGRHAVVTSGFRKPDRPNHNGLDWFYPWKPGDKPDFAGDHGAEGRKSDGTPAWVVPAGVHALAAAAGVIVFAADTPTGHAVWIDHGNGLRTGYFHLLDTNGLKAGDKIEKRAPVGEVGDNPIDRDGRHLHLELSPVDRYEPIDPEPFLLP